MTADWPIALAKGWHPLGFADQWGDGAKMVRLMGQDLRVTKAGAVSAQGVHLPVREQAGLLWTSLAPEPASFPQLPPAMEDDRLDRFWWPLPVARARVLDAVENLLDPMHSYFLHAGLVRAANVRATMSVHVTADDHGCEARYEEHGGSMTWLARLFERERTQSFGRYYAPTIVQLAFEDSRGLTIAVSAVFAPEDETHTRPYAHVASRRGLLPAWTKRLLFKAFATPILAQDRAILRDQTDTVSAFGGQDYHQCDLDFFGRHIWHLANGQSGPATTQRYEIRPEIDHICTP